MTWRAMREFVRVFMVIVASSSPSYPYVSSIDGTNAIASLPHTPPPDGGGAGFSWTIGGAGWLGFIGRLPEGCGLRGKGTPPGRRVAGRPWAVRAGPGGQ